MSEAPDSGAQPSFSGVQTEPLAPADGTTRTDRRGLFALLAGAAGVAVATGTLTGCDMVVDTDDPGVHLVRRATFGLSATSLERLRALGPAGWLDEQLDPGRIDTSAVDAKVAQLPLVAAPVSDLRVAAASEASNQVRLAALIRAVESPAQLFERMVELWGDHLNVPITDQTLAVLKTVEDRTVIRPHALGRFADLLVASAQSPAMLVYLDNAASRRQAPNENYARELLELHTVGVGNFTEDDVAATARLLTGWTVNPATGQFVFNPATHDPARITAVGWTRPATGTAVSHGVAFLTHLARHPATARMVATKVARRFATDRPSPALVEDLAAAYLANDTAIVPVLRTLFSHPEFARSTTTKFRRPLDWFVAAARATGATITPATGVRVTQLGTTAQTLGQIPFGWPAPNGYPDVEGAWMNAGALLARWNVAGDLVAGRVPLVNVPTGSLRAGLANQSTEAAVTALAARVVHEPLTKAGRDIVVEHTGLAGVARLSTAQVTQLVNRVVPLLLATPDFQYR